MNKKFKYVDLFAGIGGFHIAMDKLGGECVFACEIDKNCRLTYTENFNSKSSKIFTNLLPNNFFATDITKVEPKDIPDSDIICAGFPCQPFSQAGFKKGFEDTRGTLFFNVANIIKIKKPKVVFLENVRGLLKHDNSNTFNVIKNTVEQLGYTMFYKIIKASDFNIPQYRPRLYMICFRNDTDFSKFDFPKPIKLTTTMSDIWEGNVQREIGFTIRCGGRGSKISDRRNWDGYIVDGIEKRLSPKEGLKMLGFPKYFKFSVSDNIAMRQLGNSVAIPVIEEIGKEIIKII